MEKEEQNTELELQEQETKQNTWLKKYWLPTTLLVMLIIIGGLWFVFFVLPTKSLIPQKFSCTDIYQNQNFTFDCPDESYFVKITEQTPKNYHPSFIERGGSIDPETYTAYSLNIDNEKTKINVGVVPLNYFQLTLQFWSDKKESIEIDNREAVKYYYDHDNKRYHAYITPVSATESLIVKRYYDEGEKKDYPDPILREFVNFIRLEETDYMKGDWLTLNLEEFGFQFNYPEAVTIVDYSKSDTGIVNYILWPVDGMEYGYVRVSIYPIDTEGSLPLPVNYNSLLELNKNFEGYVEFTSDTNNSNPTVGDAVSYEYQEKKIKIDGVPALDKIHSGGGDLIGRQISILHDNHLITFYHQYDYFKRIKDSCGRWCSDSVRPFERIEEETSFDGMLSSIKFFSNQIPAEEDSTGVMMPIL